MARATQPSDAIQHPLLMPATLEHLGMDFSGDQMVVGQRDPIPLAYLAGINTGRYPCWRTGRGRGNVVYQDRPRECCGQIERLGDDAIDRQRL